MEFDVFHHAGTKHQVTNALSRLSLTGENHTTIDNVLAVVLVFSSLEEHEKVVSKPLTLTTTTMIMGFNFISPRLLLVYSVVTSKPGTNATPTTLTEMIAKQLKEGIYWQVAATVRVPGSCHSYDDHEMLVRSAFLDGLIQCGAKLRSSMSPLPLSLPETGATGLRVSYVRHHETPALLAVHGHRHLHNCRWLLQMCQNHACLKRNGHLELFHANGLL